MAAAAVAGAADRGADRPDRPQPRRRPVAERRARPHRACSSSRSASCSRRGCCCRADDRLSRPHRVRFALRAPLRASWGELREREVLVVRLDLPDGLWGEGEAAPLEPYDGVSMASRARGARRLRARCSAAIEPTADVLAACRGRARPPPGAGGDRPRAVGPRVAPHADPAGAADRPARGRRGARQRDDRRRRPRGRRRRPRRRRAGRLPLREGQGRHRRRRGPARRRARGGRAGGRRSASTPTAPGGRRRRRSRTCARWRRSGSSCARSRSTASRRCARCAPSRRCRSRWTRPTRRAPAPPTRSA